jgi:hypothetical protein
MARPQPQAVKKMSKNSLQTLSTCAGDGEKQLKIKFAIKFATGLETKPYINPKIYINSEITL